MAHVLNVGDSIPEFKVKDFEGEMVSHEDLLGSPFIIYFYPKDDTPGCTQEACEFRDEMEAFEDMDILVIGVSPDGVKSHNDFMEKHELNFPLFCDENFEMAKAFGVLQSKPDGSSSVVRSTFLFDEDGVLQWAENPVKVEGHVERVLEAVEDAFA